MEKTLFNKSGEATAYISDDYNLTIYLWEGSPVAYLSNDLHIYGINGRHLGWLIDEIIYNQQGERIGFTSVSCPVPTGKQTGKGEKRSMDQIRSKWSAPPIPKLTFRFAEQELADFLNQGQVVHYRQKVPPERATE